jgi:hypothetical protein
MRGDCRAEALGRLLGQTPLLLVGVGTKVPLGDEGRRVLDELSRIKLVDVVLPTREGTEIRRRCVTRPDEHQAILLPRLGLNLPSNRPVTDETLGRM